MVADGGRGPARSEGEMNSTLVYSIPSFFWFSERMPDMTEILLNVSLLLQKLTY